MHYLACDTTSNCAAFEYIDGQLVITVASSMPAKTLSNSTYADSAKYLFGFQGFGGDSPMPTSSSSLDRFVRASMLAQTTAGTTIPDSAFQILDSVAQGTSTQWSIVYTLGERTVYFRTQTTPKVKSVSLDAFALDCPAERKVLDIDTDATGDVASLFSDYTADLNRDLLNRSMAPIASQLPAGNRKSCGHGYLRNTSTPPFVHSYIDFISSGLIANSLPSFS